MGFANTLEVINGKLTGRTIGPIVNRERKRDLLESLAQTMDIELEQVRTKKKQTTAAATSGSAGASCVTRGTSCVTRGATTVR